MVIYAAPKPADRIPLIDPGPALDDSPDGMQAAAREIHIACRDTGFFHVRNHGIAPRAGQRAVRGHATLLCPV